MMVHYIGRIYNFNPPPEKESIIVDIPVFEQDETLPDEILIQLEDKDIKNKETEQYRNLQKITKEERELFRKNGVSVKGQKSLLDCIKRDVHSKHQLLYWSGFPSYYQLEYALTLAWNHLLIKTEKTRPMTLPKLVKVTFDYGMRQDIANLITSNYKYFTILNNEKPLNRQLSEQVLLDDAIRDAFEILRHWFHYKVPKWLSVIDSLQKYVCEKNNLPVGDYSYYSKQIENDFVRDNLSILVEYGIPKSAIDKLGNLLPSQLSEDEIIERIKDRQLLEKSRLSNYEREVILENV